MELSETYIGQYLRIVGYIPAQQRLELSCYLEPSQSIPEAELSKLRQLIAAGELPGGAPLQSAHVVFIDAATAQRVGAELKAAGALVSYYADNGELAAI